jgi:hypothetical protein
LALPKDILYLRFWSSWWDLCCHDCCVSLLAIDVSEKIRSETSCKRTATSLESFQLESSPNTSRVGQNDAIPRINLQWTRKYRKRATWNQVERQPVFSTSSSSLLHSNGNESLTRTKLCWCSGKRAVRKRGKIEFRIWDGACCLNSSTTTTLGPLDRICCIQLQNWRWWNCLHFMTRDVVQHIEFTMQKIRSLTKNAGMQIVFRFWNHVQWMYYNCRKDITPNLRTCCDVLAVTKPRMEAQMNSPERQAPCRIPGTHIQGTWLPIRWQKVQKETSWNPW